MTAKAKGPGRPPKMEKWMLATLASDLLKIDPAATVIMAATAAIHAVSETASDPERWQDSGEAAETVVRTINLLKRKPEMRIECSPGLKLRAMAKLHTVCVTAKQAAAVLDANDQAIRAIRDLSTKIAGRK